MRILIADDDPVSLKVLQKSVAKWDYEIVSCHNGEEAWETLIEDDAPRLAIVDWVMPKMDGVTLCRKLRERTDAPYVYVILVTAKDAREDIIEGLEAGADDYLVKPFDPYELKVRVRAGARIVRLQEDLIAAREDYHYQATHDPLTGLWNRTAIFEILEREMDRARRLKSPLAVIIGDLDHFKSVNDNYGHLAGDAVLREVAAVIKSSVRSYDSAGRYGGEEFIIVLPGCDRDGARSRAERMRTDIGGEPIKTAEGDFHVTVSLGVVSFDVVGPRDVDAVIRVADRALYDAKTLGRNRAVVADNGAKGAALGGTPF